MDLKELLKFVELTHQFQKIERTILIPKEERKENDLEHSAQLALVAWYLVEREKTAVGQEKNRALRACPRLGGSIRGRHVLLRVR